MPPPSVATTTAGISRPGYFALIRAYQSSNARLTVRRDAGSGPAVRILWLSFQQLIANAQNSSAPRIGKRQYSPRATRTLPSGTQMPIVMTSTAAAPKIHQLTGLIVAQR